MSRATLITGAAGFVGGHLIDLLTGASADSSANIVGWHRPGGTGPVTKPRVNWEAVDILDRASVVEAIDRLRPAVVYHCAGEAHAGKSWDRTVPTFEINVRGAGHLLDALGRADVHARVLLPGSALVYGPAASALNEDQPLAPRSPYGLSKLAQELFASHQAASNVQVMVARAFNHVGPRQDPAFSISGFARQIAAIEGGRQSPEIIVGNLNARRDITDVRDTVRAYQVIAERGQPGRPYNVCSGRAVAIGEVLNRLVARSRAPIRVQIDPARFRPHDEPLLLGDPTRIRTELGWAPSVSLDQTLDDILQYWRDAVR
jgi:GDP-4-dehydro-6-deoxy-D-mannose reductase